MSQIYKMFPTDLATFTKEILNGKLHFFVQHIFHKKSRKSGTEGISYFFHLWAEHAFCNFISKAH